MPAPRVSLAVFPFANVGADPEDEYLGDGLAEDVRARLSRLEGVRVIAATSTIRVKGSPGHVLEAARDLGVQAVVEGSVRRERDAVRITVTLLDAGRGAPLWSGTYDSSMDEIAGLGSDLASQIAQALQLHLASPVPLMEVSPPPDRRAYEDYLKGRFFWNRRTPEGLRRAIGYFEKALDTAPDYAPAHAGLADANLLLVEYAGTPPTEAMAAARSAALRALEIDGELAEAHATLGAIRFLFDWDPEAAERSFRSALELSPGYATAHHWRALHLAARRRFEEALAEVRLAEELDPLSPILGAAAGWVAYAAQRPRDAIADVENSFELEPELAQGHLILGLARLRMNQRDAALSALERAVALSGQQPRVLGILGYAYALVGEGDAARAVLDQLTVLADSSYVPASRVALVHGALGEMDRMREWLARALEERDALLPYAQAILADQPRLAALLDESGFGYGAG